MGTSPGGADWCVKALHPSDPQTEVRGIPDRSAVPSLLMNYQSTFVLGPTVGATGTWQFDASLLPHPVNFMYVDLVDSNNLNGRESNFMNTQLAGDNHISKYLTYIGMVQRWRLAYMSVTCYQDGPDLANQGSIVVAQVPTEPLVYSFSGANITNDGSLVATPKIELFTPEDRPNFIVSQGMPNAYFARSREGAYVPLKLTETCQDWVSDKDRVGTAQITPIAPQDPGNGFYALPLNSNLEGFPHVNLQPVRYRLGSSPIAAGAFTSPMLNGTWANISARNLAVATSFTFFVRCGIEMQVQPQSNLAPQLQISPPHDPIALDAYFAIARELKDGYPSDYNDLGKIWDAISAASKKVLPALKKVPGFGVPAGLLGGVVTAGDWMRGASQGKKGRKNPQKKKKKGGKQSLKRQAPPRGRTREKTTARADSTRRAKSASAGQ